jgi:hypothetical protein
MKLDFHKVYCLESFNQGKSHGCVIAMAPKQESITLLDGSTGVKVRVIVNNPVAFERRIVGRADEDDEGRMVIEAAPDEQAPGTDPGDSYTFEPLTMKLWESKVKAQVYAADDVAGDVTTDEELAERFWNDWVPDYWVEPAIPDPSKPT